MAKTSREIERTYESDHELALPDLTNVAGVAAVSEPIVTALRATYFDTPDLRLAARGITLRRRTGGDDAGWHLKLPVDTDTRDEVTLPLTRPASVVPDELAAWVEVYVRGGALAPIAQIYTHRTDRQLLDDAGEVLADVVSDRVSARAMPIPDHRATGASSPPPVRWNEVEVELAGGNVKLLSKIDRSLRVAGMRRAGVQVKLLRLLGDRVPAGPAVAVIDQDSCPGDVVHAYLVTTARRLMSLDPLVREDAHDAVHQMRVSTRRLRSALDQFGTVLEPDATRELSAELRWLAGVLGEVRDREVLRARLNERVAVVPESAGQVAIAARLAETLDAEHDQARAELITVLDSDRYFALLDALDRLLITPPYTKRARKAGRDPLEQVVRRSWKRLERRAATIDAATPDATVHSARRAAKRFRYAIEAVTPAYGRPALRAAKAMVRIQDLLGAHQDSCVAREVVAKLANSARAAGEDTFGYGLLYEMEATAARDAVRDLPGVWAAAARTRERTWR